MPLVGVRVRVPPIALLSPTRLIGKGTRFKPEGSGFDSQVGHLGVTEQEDVLGVPIGTPSEPEQLMAGSIPPAETIRVCVPQGEAMFHLSRRR